MTLTFPYQLPKRYKFLEKVGLGGEGAVFVCMDTFLERKVAVKVLHSPGTVASLRKELRMLTEISSRHIVDCYDLIVGTNPHEVGLVQEYVDGLSLLEFVKSSEPSTFSRIMWQLASGVADIHSYGKIHRDLKPDNIRIDSEGVLKILDFGLSSESIRAETVLLRGTFYYAAPELFAISPVTLEQSYDVYALGILARFIAGSGELPPFIQPKPKHVNRLPSIGLKLPFLSPESTFILDSTLNFQPTNRPTAVEVRDVLTREILFGKHRAQVTYGGTVQTLTKPNDKANLRSGADTVTVLYTGFAFVVTEAAGDVYINNQPITIGQKLPKSCVVTIGGPH